MPHVDSFTSGIIHVVALIQHLWAAAQDWLEWAPLGAVEARTVDGHAGPSTGMASAAAIDEALGRLAAPWASIGAAHVARQHAHVGAALAHALDVAVPLSLAARALALVGVPLAASLHAATRADTKDFSPCLMGRLPVDVHARPLLPQSLLVFSQSLFLVKLILKMLFCLLDNMIILG